MKYSVCKNERPDYLELSPHIIAEAKRVGMR